MGRRQYDSLVAYDIIIIVSFRAASPPSGFDSERSRRWCFSHADLSPRGGTVSSHNRG